MILEIIKRISVPFNFYFDYWQMHIISYTVAKIGYIWFNPIWKILTIQKIKTFSSNMLFSRHNTVPELIT